MLRTKQILDFVNDVQSAMSSINATQDAAIALNTAKVSDINHNVTTDLSYTAAPAKGTVVSSDGTDAVLPLADAENAGLLSPAEKTAIANSATDAELSAAISQEVIDRNAAIKVTNDRVTTLLAGSTEALDTFGEIKTFIEGLSDADVSIIEAVALNTAKETNVTTNLSYTAAPAKGTVVSSDGTDAVLPLADATNAGLLSPAKLAEIAANTDKAGISSEQAEKIAGIEANATADQTADEIRELVEAAEDSNVFTDADHSKLDGIEDSADVTDDVNVRGAGALMDDEVTNLDQVKSFSSADYATAAQGLLADAAATEVDLTKAEDRIAALESDISGFGFDSVEEVGDFVAANEFRSKTAVQFAANDELDIFVNGLQVHRATWANEELKAAAEGWTSLDGVTFTVQNLGYDLDAADHIIISGKVA